MEQINIQIIDNKKSKDIFMDIMAHEVDAADSNDRFITVDTEFIREGVENPYLCLMQIATENHNFIIDPLAIDISFLREIFSDNDLLKVFHAAYQDIEMLYSFGIEVRNIHDTQVYEMILSTKERISYQSIVSKYLSKKLNKTHSLSDWGKRPLSKKQLIYSIEDVFFLRDVYKKQKQSLFDAGRARWLDDEMTQLAERNASIDVSMDSSGGVNIKNDDDIYRRLVQWRENRAREKGIDPKSIAADRVIKSICKKGRTFIANMENSRYVKDDNTKEFFIFADKIIDDIVIKTKVPSKNIILHILKAILGIVSKENNIAASIIATANDLEKISLGAAHGKCFSGWREEIFGNYVREFFNGNLSISMKDSETQLRIAEKRI